MTRWLKAVFIISVPFVVTGAGPAVRYASTNKILLGAKAQLVHPASYTGAYYSISYPGGDVPSDRGACTDVVIRALRFDGYDLQKLIHEDMARNLSSYPRRGKKLDTNIDHRRVPNQRVFFSRHGLTLTTSTSGPAAKSWRPGDIVTWKLIGGLDHTGVISDLYNPQGLPYVIHNIGPHTAEEDVVTGWKITGHYRYPK